MSRTSAKSNMFSPSHTRISQSQASLFNVECPWIPNFSAGHPDGLQHKPSRQVAVYVIVLVSVCWQLAFGLSHINTFEIEGSQIIAFLAYRPLTLPPLLEPLFPPPPTLLPCAGDYHILHLTLNEEKPPILSLSKQRLS